MTFDEAVREYQLRSLIGPLVQGIQVSPFVNVPQQEYDRVKFLNNLFYETINKLRKEYAPTVEMTKFQKGFLLHYLENFSFHEFISDVYMARYSSKEIDLNDKYEHLSDEDLMQAWLHPETIKVVDE